MPSQQALFLLAAVAVGAVVAIQPAVNSRLSGELGHPFLATVISFSVGLLTIVLVSLVVLGKLPSPTKLAEAPRWSVLGGGILGALFVTSAVVLVPKIGLASWTAAIVTGQVLCSLALDRFGAFGVQRIELSPTRLLGGALVVIGTLLVVRSRNPL